MNRDKDDLLSLLTELQQSEVISNIANLNNFLELNSNQKKIYLGVDCTSNSLHIGHLFLFFQSLRFVRKGFSLIILLGGATSKIGDPTDKKEERILLNDDNLFQFVSNVKEQIKRILLSSFDFAKFSFAPLEKFYSRDEEKMYNLYSILGINKNDDNVVKWKKYISFIFPLESFEKEKIVLLNNYSWFSNLNVLDFAFATGRWMSLNYLLSKDWIKERKNSGISFFSFNYPLFQAYDFLYLYKNYSCFGQLGGSDQWGNLTTGLKLIKSYFPENKSFSFSFKLLTNKKGEKISKSKSSSTNLWLSSLNNHWWDFFNNMEDELAIFFLRQFTFISNDKIKEIVILNNPKKLRIPQRLLYELLSILTFREC